MPFLDNLVIFRLDLGQITFNPTGRKCVCNKTAWLSCHQHRVLVHICDSSMRRNQSFEIALLEEKVTYIFRLSDLWNFFFTFPFSPFLFFFAAVIDLLLGLLAIKKLLRKRHQDGQFLAWSSQVKWQEILL